MSILQDPVMQSILQQAKGDPNALAEHMRNPQVRTKIQKVRDVPPHRPSDLC